MKSLERKFNKEKIKKAYKNAARLYNLWSLIFESKSAGKVIEIAAIKDGKSVLEVACGTGVVFEQVVIKNPKGKNVGIDLSEDMLEKARKRLKKLKNTNYELKEGDALNLEFQNNSFDILINNFMIDLMPTEYFDKIAGEFYRVLKPGGIVVISTFAFGKKRFNKVWFWIARKYPSLLTECRPVYFKNNLTKAGFEIENDLEISQNTFPSNIIKARKPTRPRITEVK